MQHLQKGTFNGPFSGTTLVSRYQKGKTNLDFTEARDSEWQWHPLSHTQVCTSLQTDNQASTPPLSFLQAGCPSCHPTNSVKALKASIQHLMGRIQSIDFIYTHTHPFNGPLSGTTQVSLYQKGKTNLDFTGARDSEWQWHQLGMCKSALCSREITMPAPHHSVFYRPDALPAAQPTASKH